MNRTLPDLKRKTPNTECRTSNAEWAIICWSGDGRGKEDTGRGWLGNQGGRPYAPLHGATRQTDSTPNAQRKSTTQEIYMKTKRETPNIERQTSNAKWKGPLFRVNEANSDYTSPKKTKYDLEDRLLEFAVAVVELTDDLPNTRAGNHLAGQLLRCGTSPYGHHGEVESAESHKDFIHKLKVCLKEPRETDGGSGWYHGSSR
jgi:hypothetical protein